MEQTSKCFHSAALPWTLLHAAAVTQLNPPPGGHGWETGRRRLTSNSREDLCSSPRIGYSPLDVARSLNLLTPATYVRTTTRALSRVMILHPVAALLNALAFGFVFAIPVLGSSLACLFSTAAFVAVALTMVSDFVLFGMVRAAVNQDGRSGSTAEFGVAMWCVLVAAICTFEATMFVLGSCCVGRSGRRRSRDAEKAGEAPAAPVCGPAAAPAVESAPETAPAAPADGATHPKRRFWKRG
ncbi:hypothetical protein VUR80DRAFT_6000 [Thermomyces stellatus]